MMPSPTATPVNVRLPEGVSAARAAAKAVDLGHLPEWTYPTCIPAWTRRNFRLT